MSVLPLCVLDVLLIIAYIHVHCTCNLEYTMYMYVTKFHFSMDIPLT